MFVIAIDNYYRSVPLNHPFGREGVNDAVN